MILCILALGLIVLALALRVLMGAADRDAGPDPAWEGDYPE
jgi:hypothetical protein